MKTLNRSMDACELELDSFSISKAQQIVQSVLNDNMQVPETSYEVVIDGMTAELAQGVNDSVEEPDSSNDEETGSRTYVGEETKAKKSVLAQVAYMVAADDFKKLCQDIHQRSEMILRNHTEKAFFDQAYLFSINPGSGYSHSLRLMADLLQETGLHRGKSGESEVKEIELPSPLQPDCESRMDSIVRRMEGGFSAQRIYSYDITEWIGHTSKRSFKKLLMGIAQHNQNCMHVFRVSELSARLLKQSNKEMNDLLSVQTVQFQPFSEEDQHVLAERMLAESGITVDQNSWNIFDERIREEKSDGYFYGVHTIHKVANEMIRRMEAYNLENELDNKLITSEKIQGLASPREQKHVDAQKELEALIGIPMVKEAVLQIVDQIEASVNEGQDKKPVMHMCFVGNPGTGKTTVARILGAMLGEKGLLRIGNFYEYRGRDLCGRYVGETAIKTTEICREAYGSILFIDEAYSLFRGDRSSVDYGREALDTLIAEMENRSDDLIVIFAGYPQEIETMISGNTGMSSRIPYTISFPNYTREELCQIFLRKTSETFSYGEEFEEAVRNYFEGLPEELLSRPDFGNARYVRNLYERMWGKAKARMRDEEVKDDVVLVEDFEAMTEELGYQNREDQKKSTIGFL